MPRYEYRLLKTTPEAEQSFQQWIDQLDREFANRDPEHRCNVVRDALHELYLGKPYRTPEAGDPLAAQTLVHSFDPRNATLEPEYYGDVDAAKYAERKPLIWFWMMYDRSPVGLNHGLGYRVRAMLARHVLKHCGKNVKIFHGVEVTFGYNLTIEDNCTIHKYVLLDDRGELIIHARQFDLRLRQRVYPLPRFERWNDHYKSQNGNWPEGAGYLSCDRPERCDCRRTWHGRVHGRGFEECGALPYCGGHSGEDDQGEDDRARRRRASASSKK